MKGNELGRRGRRRRAGGAERLAPANRLRAKDEAARSRARRWRSWLLQGGALLAVVIVVSTWQTRRHLASAEPAPGFALRSLGGETVRLSELRGKRVLLHFWATWCGVCKLETGALNAVHDGLGPDEVLLSVVADAEDIEHVRRAVNEHGIRYPVLLADDSVLTAYRVSSFPTNYFLSADGTVSSTSVGLTTRVALWARLAWAR